MTTPRVLALVPEGDAAGCLLWRHWWPSSELKKHGHTYDWCRVTDYRAKVEPKLLSGDYNVVVTPRFTWHEEWMLESWLNTLEKAHMTWVYEADDDLFSPEVIDLQVGFVHAMEPNTGLTYEELDACARAQKEYERTERIHMLRLIDGITVSTNPLGQVVRQFTQATVNVVPNAMDLGWWNTQVATVERTIPPLTIGWTGGWRQSADVDILSEVWPIIARRFPEVHFVLHGWAIPSVLEVLPANRLHFFQWSPIEKYPAILKNIDIGCCVVADTRWNMNKSCIKWYELSMSGAACVASHALYGQAIMPGIDGLLATTADEWVEQLSRLIVDARLRRSLVRQAQRTITDHHNIALSWPQWINAWSKMLNNKLVAA